MTDYISFPQVETFSAKKEFYVVTITNQQKSGNENLKKKSLVSA